MIFDELMRNRGLRAEATAGFSPAAAPPRVPRHFAAESAEPPDQADDTGVAAGDADAIAPAGSDPATSSTTDPVTTSTTDPSTSALTARLVRRALDEHETALRADLHGQVQSLGVAEFAHLVMRVLRAYDYQVAGEAELDEAGSWWRVRIGALGEQPYLVRTLGSIPAAPEARRDASVALGDAMRRAGLDRGVLVTLDATATAAAEPSITVIGHDRLMDLMLERNIGVSHHYAVAVHQVDRDFFATL